MQYFNPSANDKTRHLLLAIDTFSKFIWLQTLQNKKTETVMEAFEIMCSDDGE